MVIIAQWANEYVHCVVPAVYTVPLYTHTHRLGDVKMRYFTRSMAGYTPR